MGTERTFLDGLQIAKPCPASWEGMTGDDRVRACEACHLNVYNLSAMTRAEAEQLVRSREGRMCIRMLRRADGTAITRDCPKGIRAFRYRVARAAAFIVGLLTLGTLARARTSLGTVTATGEMPGRPLDQEPGPIGDPSSASPDDDAVFRLHVPESRPTPPRGR